MRRSLSEEPVCCRSVACNHEQGDRHKEALRHAQANGHRGIHRNTFMDKPGVRLEHRHRHRHRYRQTESKTGARTRTHGHTNAPVNAPKAREVLLLLPFMASILVPCPTIAIPAPLSSPPPPPAAPSSPPPLGFLENLPPPVLSSSTAPSSSPSAPFSPPPTP